MFFAGFFIQGNTANQVPVANNDTKKVAQNAGATTIDVLANDTDGDNDTLTVTSVTQPTHGSATFTATGVTYTPQAGYSGPDSFTYTVSDGKGGTAIGTVNVTVNTPPIGVGDAYSTNEDTPLTVTPKGVLLNDTDANGDTLTAVLASGTTNGILTLNPNGGFVYTPTANFFGADSFTYRANDGFNTSALATVNLTVNPVNDAPTFTAPTSLTTNEFSGPLTFANLLTNISAGPANENGQTLTFTTNNNNNALFAVQPTFDANGTLTFTLAPDAFGTATVTVFLKDSGGTANGGVDTSATKTLTITVNPVNDAPTFTAAVNPTVNEDSGAQTIANVLTNITAGPANENGQTLTITANNNNNALFSVQPTISANGTLSFTPAPNAFGTATVTVSLKDDGGTANGGVDTTTKTFTITVNPVNDAPTFTLGANQTVNEDSGAQTATIATAISAGPANESGQGLTFTTTNNNNALFSVQPTVTPAGVLNYTPAPNANGTATVTVTLKDNGGTANGGIDTSVTKTFTINVTAVNDNPVAGNQTVTTPEDTALSITLTATDVDLDPLTFTVTGNPTHGTLTGTGANLTYTPAANYNGPDVITFSVSDGNGGTSTGTININVTPVNDPPVAINQNLTTLEDTALPIVLTGTDVDGNTLTFSISGGPAHGTITGSGATRTYTPAANYNGPDVITFTVNDGNGGTATGTININVTPVNDAPVAVNDNYSVNEDTTLTVTAALGVLGNDTDVDNVSLNAALVVAPTHGTVTLNPNGSFSYVPDANYNGPDSFTYVANDGSLNSNIATVNINVISVNDNPVAGNQTVTTLEDTPLPIVLTSTDTDGGAPTYTVTGGPAHGYNHGHRRQPDLHAGCQLQRPRHHHLHCQRWQWWNGDRHHQHQRHTSQRCTGCGQ